MSEPKQEPSWDGQQLVIPTYDPDNEETGYDRSRPHTLTLQDIDGLRVVLGEPNDPDAPDVMIERDTKCWRIIIHPNAGDTFCIVEISETEIAVKSDVGGAQPLLTEAREGALP